MKNRIIIAALLVPAFALSVFSSPVNNTVQVETVYESAYTVTDTEQSYQQLSDVLTVSISTPEQFNDFASKVNSAAEGYSAAVCALTCNIDFDGKTLIPIGTSSHPFSGTFDGNGYTISNFVAKKTNFCGVIGYMSDGNIRNLAVENGKIEFSHSISVSAGLICGYAENSVSGESVIENCSSSGIIDVSCTGASLNVGGIAGKIISNKGNFNVNNCFSNADITVSSNNSCYTGGVAGHVSAMSSAVFTFKNCYSDGNVKYATGSAHMYAGGFAGYLNQDEAGWSDWFSEDSDTEAELTGNIVSCFADTDIVCENVLKENAGYITGYKGDNVIIANSYYSSEAKVDGGVICNAGSAVDRVNFSDADYLANTLKFDMTDVWYVHDNNLPYLKALCPSNGAPVAVNGASIRVVEPMGIRFMAFANNMMRSYSAEYGFIVALKDTLGDNELTFDSNIRYVSGASFIADGENAIDRIYQITEEGVNFTAVLINIPDTQYKTVFVARPYVKFVSGGETVVMYGNAVERSPYQVAVAIHGSSEYDTLTDEAKNVIDNMIAG